MARKYGKGKGPVPFTRMTRAQKLEVLGRLYEMARKTPEGAWTFDAFKDSTSSGDKFCLIGHAAQRPELAAMLNLEVMAEGSSDVCRLDFDGEPEFLNDYEDLFDDEWLSKFLMEPVGVEQWNAARYGEKIVNALEDEHQPMSLREVALLRLLYLGHMIEQGKHYKIWPEDSKIHDSTDVSLAATHDKIMDLREQLIQIRCQPLRQ